MILGFGPQPNAGPIPTQLAYAGFSFLFFNLLKFTGGHMIWVLLLLVVLAGLFINSTYPADCIPQWGMVGTFSPHVFCPPGSHTFSGPLNISAREFRWVFLKARPGLPANFTHRPPSCSKVATCAQHYQQAHPGYATATLPTRSH
jgi:hypothetical protein